MRLYEWISLVFYAAFAALAWRRPLPLRRRSLVTAIAVVGIAGILRLRSTAARDWLPLAFIPLAYWQTGQFLLPLNNWFQSKLESFDRKHLGRRSPPFMWLLELCYLFCYPSVPLGLVALYLSGMGASPKNSGMWSFLPLMRATRHSHLSKHSRRERSSVIHRGSLNKHHCAI